MSESDVIPSLDCVVEEGNLRAGVTEVLKILRPDWDATNVEIKDLSRGYANKNYAIMNGSEGLFLRLINPGMLSFLPVAINCMRYLKRRSIGAELLLTFNNGLVMELLDGQAIVWDNVGVIKEPDNWRGLAREIARYHGTTNVDDIKELGIMNHDQVVKFFLPQLKPIEATLKSLDLPSPDELFVKIEKIFESLLNDGADWGFCHLDANPTNVIVTADGPVLVDYDMCAYDLCPANVASIFCSVTNIQNFSFDDQPTADEKDVFIREYLRARSEIQPGFGPVDESMVKHWKFMVEKAHLSFYCAALGTIVLMQTMSPKDLDVGIAKALWEKYQQNEKIIYMKYSKE